MTTKLCKTCGKAPLANRAGVFTSLLFKELRCQCPGPVLTSKRSSISAHRTATAQRLNQRRQFTQMRISDQGLSGQLNSQQVLPTDSIIGGAFRVIKMLGMGGMGVVYLVEQLSLRKQVALKVLAPEFVNEQNWLRFQSEAKTLAALNHATLVKVYDLGIHDRCLPFYSMDYLPGHNLEEILIADGPLALERALPIFIEVLAGLAYAHRNGIIHRDLKPSNIMLCTAGGATEVKILDFGISKLVAPGAEEAQSLTSTGEVFGSPYYMSPEQCVGDVVDARSDIYSIGCSLFEVLTGFVPFEGRSSVETVTMHQDRDVPCLSAVSPDRQFPSSIELVLAKCLAKMPQDRYQSAKELSLDLERILAGKDVLTFNRVVPEAELVEENSVKAFPLGLAIAVSSLLIAGLIAIYLLLALKSSQPLASERKAVALESNAKPGSPLSPPNALAQKKGIAERKSQVDSGYESFVAIVGDADYSIGAYSDGQEEPKGSQFETAKYSTTKVVNGERMISFNFPTDTVIGKLYIGHDDPGVDARGVVECRRSVPLTFMPSKLVGKYPQYIKRFGPDDLHGVLIYSSAGDDSVLQAAANLPDIEFLSVMANTELTSSSIVSFNKFRNLKTFDASSCYLSGSVLASATCWSKLEQLYWSSPKDPAPFLKKLQSSPELNFLKLSGASLSHDQFLLIAKLVNLRRLDLSQSKISKDDLMALSALDKLIALNVKDCQIGLDDIPVLRKFKALTDLQILSSGTSDSMVAALRSALPGVRIH